MMLPFVLIITGPTASGKTGFTETIAAQIPCEIINADVGQMYAPLSIGTAKFKDGKAVGYHGFDLFDFPYEYNIADYHRAVIGWVEAIHKRGNLPVIVGGSFFYIKSLFFPPILLENKESVSEVIDWEKDSEILWKKLQEIDNDRAKVLHPNDRYRVIRALKLWQQSGTKPSLLKALLNPSFKAIIVSVEPEVGLLNEAINHRTEQMLNNGWIDETQALVNTEWESFIRRKGMIGYAEIFDWIKDGKAFDKMIELIAIIQLKTRQYAKRQRAFWKGLRAELGTSPLVTIYTAHTPSKSEAIKIIQLVKSING